MAPNTDVAPILSALVPHQRSLPAGLQTTPSVGFPDRISVLLFDAPIGEVWRLTGRTWWYRRHNDPTGTRLGSPARTYSQEAAVRELLVAAGRLDPSPEMRPAVDRASAPALPDKRLLEFGQLLRDRRLAAGLSCIQLARRAHLSDTTIKFAETATHLVSRATLIRLIEVKELQLTWADVSRMLSSIIDTTPTTSPLPSPSPSPSMPSAPSAAITTSELSTQVSNTDSAVLALVVERLVVCDENHIVRHSLCVAINTSTQSYAQVEHWCPTTTTWTPLHHLLPACMKTKTPHPASLTTAAVFAADIDQLRTVATLILRGSR